NYKSLRNVAIEPTPLSVFVGPNAAGKTNLADAIDFLKHVYSWGLEKAVAYKGGYENIFFRGKQQSLEPIRFRLMVEIPLGKVLPLSGLPNVPKMSKAALFVEHEFQFKAVSRRMRSVYRVVFERLVLSLGISLAGNLVEIRRVTRDGDLVEAELGSTL